MKLLISTIVLLGLIKAEFFLIDKLNESRKDRSRQFAYPIIGLVYSIIAVVLITNYLVKIRDLLAQIGALSFMSFIPRSFLPDIYIIVINLALLAVFFLVKLFAKRPVRKVWANDDMVQTTSSFFYDYNDKYEVWLVRLRYGKLRTVFNVILWITTIAACIILSLTRMSTEELDFSVFGFPCAALLVLNEMYAFINGLTEEEFSHSVGGDDVAATSIRNYFRLREIYEKLIPDPIRASRTEFTMKRQGSVVEEMDKLKNSDDKYDRFTYDFFNVNNRYFKADRDYMELTRELMHRRNIVCFDPFYKDLGLYIALPIMYTLMAGKKIMVITGKITERSVIGDWLRGIISECSHLKSVWSIENLSDRIPICDVGLISFPQLYDTSFIMANREFFRDTDMVLMFEPSGILSTGQMALSIISREMRAADSQPVYFICDRYADGLVDTVSHVLQSEFTDVTPSQAPQGIFTSMVWDADGDYDRQDLFNRQAQFLGNGVELAAVAVRNQIPEVTWYSRNKMPIRDAKWIAGQDYDSICKYMNIPEEQSSLYERIGFRPDIWGAEKQDAAVLIAEDEYCNAFSVVRSYQSRGTKQSFVHIISENYMMRDYMCSNVDVFSNNPHAIPSLVSDYAKTERNILFLLLVMMSYRAVPETEVIDEFHLAGVEVDDAEAVLDDMLKRYTFAPSKVITKYEHRDSLTTFRITGTDFDDYFADSLKNAYYIVENEEHGAEFIDARMYSHVVQNVLPGQLITYDGKYYQVKYVSPESGVVLRRASDMFDDRRYYRQEREYDFDADDIDGRAIYCHEIMGIEFTSFLSDIKVRTKGYLDMDDPHDFATAKQVEVTGDGQEDYVRTYHNKRMLRVSLPDPDSTVTSMLVILMNEILRTLYPDCSQYVAVLADHSQEVSDAFRGVLPKRADDKACDGYIYIVEDSDIDIGVLDSIERNFMEIMGILTEYLTWDQKLCDEAESYTDKRYLNFGYEDLTLPAKEALEYLKAHRLTDNALTKARECEPNPMPVLDTDAVNHCDFCGMPISGINYEVLNDGRIRCQDCSRSVIHSSDELKFIFDQILELMESLYGVRYNKPVTVTMMDARKMGRVSGVLFTPSEEFAGRVQGLATSSKDGSYNVFIENGSPRLAAISTMVHELTHIWQYLNWDEAKLASIYGTKPGSHTDLDFLYEGMACWSAIQYMYLIGETSYAREQELLTASRDDIYGAGFRWFCSQYPLIKGFGLLTSSPFMNMPPLDPGLTEAQVVETAVVGVDKTEIGSLTAGSKHKEAAAEEEPAEPEEPVEEPAEEAETPAETEEPVADEPVADAEPAAVEEPVTEAEDEPEPVVEPEPVAEAEPEPVAEAEEPEPVAEEPATEVEEKPEIN